MPCTLLPPICYHINTRPFSHTFIQPACAWLLHLTVPHPQLNRTSHALTPQQPHFLQCPLTCRISVLSALSPRSVTSFSSRPPPAPASTMRPAIATGEYCLRLPGALGSLIFSSPVSTNCFKPFSPPAKPPVAPAERTRRKNKRLEIRATMMHNVRFLVYP